MDKVRLAISITEGELSIEERGGKNVTVPVFEIPLAVAKQVDSLFGLTYPNKHDIAKATSAEVSRHSPLYLYFLSESTPKNLV